MEYMMVNGYQIPALTLNEPPMPEIGKYGSLRRKFLLENAPMMFDEMMLEGTLYPHLVEIPDHADTASDALALSIGERAKVDMPYMMHLTGKDEATLAKELAGVIFVEPFRKQEDSSPVYLMADEYLSGNVREKLRVAHVAADQDPAFRINVEALEQVQPKDLTAGEITVRLGVTWIGPEIIKQFADELFQSTYREQKIAVSYNEYLNNWYISNKSQGNDNIRVTNTYGTKRINGYHLLENALNLRATKIYDTIYDENGKEQHKLNGPATEEAELAAQEERNEVKQDEQRRRSSRSDGAGSLTGYRSSH